MDATATCLSIKSAKNPREQCKSKATKGDFCARHCKSRILWTDTPKKTIPFTRKQRAAIEKIYRFFNIHCRRHLRRSMGPCIFVPESAENDSDLLTLQPVTEIPFKYRFSYIDVSGHAWIFDVRFFIQLAHHGNELKNPFTQSPLTQSEIKLFQKRVEILRIHKVPILYVEEGELTTEQNWNQKVLDIFLKMNSLGFSVNVVWFDMMTVTTHERFYTNLYNLWTHNLGITEEQKEILVPGHSSGRTPLFRWVPDIITYRRQELKWWRKQSLGLMKAFLTRSKDPITQGSNALTILTALANCHTFVAEAFPWLV